MDVIDLSKFEDIKPITLSDRDTNRLNQTVTRTINELIEQGYTILINPTFISKSYQYGYYTYFSFMAKPKEQSI